MISLFGRWQVILIIAKMINHPEQQSHYKNTLQNSLWISITKEMLDLLFIIMHQQQVRPKRIINTSNQNDQKYIKMLRGERSDTKQLNINIKTLTLSHLHDLQAANQLTHSQSQIVKNYSRMSPSFHSIIYLLFGKDSPLKLKKKAVMQQQQFKPNQTKEKSPVFLEARANIRQYCQTYYRSSQFIRNFLKSPRMNFKNKLIIVKFLNKIECLAKKREAQMQWKNSLRQFRK